MINRTIVRTRVLQTLFAYYKDGEKTPLTAKKELLRSFTYTYDLYMMLLDLSSELVGCAERQMDERMVRARVRHESYVPNRNFVDCLFAQQLFQNRMVRNYMSNEHLSWETETVAIETLYKQLQETEYYREYMGLSEPTYEDGMKLWKKIYSYLLFESEVLSSALEELEVVLDKSNWSTDMNVVISYVVKTLRLFSSSSDADTAVLPMFDNELEARFGQDLLEKSIANQDEYMELIKQHLRNWDADRVAYMDRLILQVALAEVLGFPEIAVEISLNEYVELAKEYSGERNYLFINGIMDEILRYLKKENKLIKSMRK